MEGESFARYSDVCTSLCHISHSESRDRYIATGKDEQRSVCGYEAKGDSVRERRQRRCACGIVASPNTAYALTAAVYASFEPLHRLGVASSI